MLAHQDSAGAECTVGDLHSCQSHDCCSLHPSASSHLCALAAWLSSGSPCAQGPAGTGWGQGWPSSAPGHELGGLPGLPCARPHSSCRYSAAQHSMKQCGTAQHETYVYAANTRHARLAVVVINMLLLAGFRGSFAATLTCHAVLIASVQVSGQRPSTITAPQHSCKPRQDGPCGLGLSAHFLRLAPILASSSRSSSARFSAAALSCSRILYRSARSDTSPCTNPK